VPHQKAQPRAFRDTPSVSSTVSVSCVTTRQAQKVSPSPVFLPFSHLIHPTIKMFAKLTTKIALRKAGIPSNALSMPEFQGSKDPNASPFANVSNPFANLSVPNVLKSWATPPPPPIEIAPVPVLSTRAPETNRLRLPVLDGRPSVVVFLRHCGCPCMSPEHPQRKRD